jgi:hypothetical protein
MIIFSKNIDLHKKERCLKKFQKDNFSLEALYDTVTIPVAVSSKLTKITNNFIQT